MRSLRNANRELIVKWHGNRTLALLLVPNFNEVPVATEILFVFARKACKKREKFNIFLRLSILWYLVKVLNIWTAYVVRAEEVEFFKLSLKSQNCSFVV